MMMMMILSSVGVAHWAHAVTSVMGVCLTAGRYGKVKVG